MITPLAQSSMVILGAGLLFLSYVLFSIRSNTAESTVEWDMTIFYAGLAVIRTRKSVCRLALPYRGRGEHHELHPDRCVPGACSDSLFDAKAKSVTVDKGAQKGAESGSNSVR